MQFIRVGMAQPVRDPKRLTRLLRDKIETIDPGFGIEIMVLVAIEAEPLRDKQTISSLVEAPEANVSDLVDVLTNRVGDANAQGEAFATRLRQLASAIGSDFERLKPRAEDWNDQLRTVTGI